MISLTVRLHTPPRAFCSFQYSWWACVPGWPNGAKMPDRSVNTPNVIVLAVMPGPPLTPPDELESPELELLPHAPTATHSAAAATMRNVRLMPLLPLPSPRSPPMTLSVTVVNGLYVGATRPSSRPRFDTF